ncbi:MAG: NAD(P)-binding protein [Thermoleophilia bacterium]|jgi:NADPH-dependent glutamate synthase beta subunit-like oxidoreductase/NAD-dependent dihydropyrimidine dehydrogenase PreA subunit
MAVVLKIRKREVGAAGYSRGSEGSHLRPVYKKKIPPCSNACPAGNDIRGFLTTVSQTEMFKREYDESFVQAWRLLTDTNPLPSIIGRVCPHFCETDCNRNAKDGAVSINQVERYLGDYGLNHNLKHEKLTDEVKTDKIAVVGSGPAGLSAAFQMARRGYPVTIFEAFEKSGGMLRYGIPSYRLPEDILDAEVAAIADLGVEIKYGTRIGVDVSMDDLKKDYAAIYLGIGAHEGWTLGVPGEEGEGVMSAVEFLNKVNAGESMDVSGKKVLIIGGGNSAVDAARVSWRMGAESQIVYRRTREEMPAEEEEIDDTLEEGINIEYLTAPVEIIRDGGKVTGLKCIRMELGEPDDSGRRRPEPVAGSEFVIDCDMVLPAIGQGAQFDGLDAFKDEKGWITVDEATGATSEDGVWAGGDVTNKLGTVTEAIGLGRKAANAMDYHIRGEEIPKEFPAKIIKSDKMALNYYAEAARVEKSHIPVSDRKGNFNEVVSTWTDDQCKEETLRCMSCGMCFDCGNCYSFCSYSAVKKLDVRDEDGNPYKFRLEVCVGCAKCAEECPCGYIDMS